MDTQLDTLYKTALKPTRSLDEGFESDPDRISSCDSNSADENTNNNKIKNSNNHSHPKTHNQPSPNKIRFNVLQRTDRDGVQHTQIARRRPDHHWNSGPPGIIFIQSPGSTANSTANFTANADSVDSHIMTIARNNLPSTASQMLPAASSANQQDAYRRRLSPKANFSHTSGVLRSQSVDAIRPILLPKIKLNPNQQHAQPPLSHVNSKYGAHNSQGGQLSQLSSTAVVPSRITNTNSMYTFYPAEGNISLYPSHYGLTYKSSHLNMQSQAPVSWTQSVPRQQRRYI